MDTQKILKLHLGCGQKYLQGYVNIDYPATEHTVMNVKADVYADIRTLHYEDNSVDEIRARHVFEHFSRQEALRLLLEWRRWLKPMGLLHLETPDFTSSVSSYIHSGLKRKFELGRHIFGSQEAPWAYHLDFWDKQKFEFVLQKLGFTDVRVRQCANSFAEHFPFVPFANFIGSAIPQFIYKAVGKGHKLPNIIIESKKGDGELDERLSIESILFFYLFPTEGKKLLEEWMKQVFE